MARRFPHLPALIAAGAVVAGLLVGGAPAQAEDTYGILVSASAAEDLMATPPVMTYQLIFKAQPGLAESDIGVRRVGNSLVVFEENGGPSLGVATDSPLCSSASTSGPSTEVTCTFPTPTSATVWRAVADFSKAPRGVSFFIEEGSAVEASFKGSVFDDYFQGGDLGDGAAGGMGNDDIFGGGGWDFLFGDGDGDYIDGEGDGDTIYAGPGDDNVIGGPGSDYIVGGTGKDDIDAKDGVKDYVDCGDWKARAAKGFEQGNTLDFDKGLDDPIDCGTQESPTALVPPNISSTSVKIGETITGTNGQWRGTAPIRYSYRFERCRFSPDWGSDCTTVKKGDLDSAGLEAGRPAAYKVVKEDRGFSLRFVVVADNTSKGGGGTETANSPPSDPVATAVTYTTPRTWLPSRQGKTWSFTDVDAVRIALESSAIAPYADIELVPLRRLSVDSQYRKIARDGSVVRVRVNDKEMQPGSPVTIEAAADERASVVIYYYSWLMDRQVACPTDQGMKIIQGMIPDDGLTLIGLTWLLSASTCPWVVEWSDEVSSRPLMTVSNAVLEETDDDEHPFQVRITAKRPSLSAGLTMLVAAPPHDYVAASPNEFSIGMEGNLFAFPNRAWTTIWTGLLGDQVRNSSNRGMVEIFLNGKRVLSKEFGTGGPGDTPFSTLASASFNEPGMARVVVTTFGTHTWGESITYEAPDSQVYMDFPVTTTAGLESEDIMSWDGRCFTPGGLPGNCSEFQPRNASRMVKVLADAGAPILRIYWPASAALRAASEDLGRRFTLMGVNSNVANAMANVSSRTNACAGWWDIACHVSNAFEAWSPAVIQPRAVDSTKKPAKRTIRVKSMVARVSPTAPLGGSLSPGVMRVPGMGLIGLDGANLISDMGGGLIGLDGANLIGLDGANLIGLDGANLIGLDGANLIGLDGANLIGLDGANVNVPLISFSRR